VGEEESWERLWRIWRVWHRNARREGRRGKRRAEVRGGAETIEGNSGQA
jgi:hypothetical protein